MHHFLYKQLNYHSSNDLLFGSRDNSLRISLLKHSFYYHKLEELIVFLGIEKCFRLWAIIILIKLRLI